MTWYILDRLQTRTRNKESYGQETWKNRPAKERFQKESCKAIRSISLSAPLAGERARHKRAISRSYAEWPLVEVCARAVIADGAFKFVRIAAGGIAPVPLRLNASEAALEGRPPTEATIANAAKLAVGGANPLPMTGYKLQLLSGLVRDLLTQLAA